MTKKLTRGDGVAASRSATVMKIDYLVKVCSSKSNACDPHDGGRDALAASFRSSCGVQQTAGSKMPPPLRQLCA
jgi:hypothetical protein